MVVMFLDMTYSDSISFTFLYCFVFQHCVLHANHEADGADPSSEDHADDEYILVMLHRTLHLQLIYFYFSVFILQNFQQEFLYPRIHVSVLCMFICVYLYTSIYSTYHMYLSFQWPIFFSGFQMFDENG